MGSVSGWRQVRRDVCVPGLNKDLFGTVGGARSSRCPDVVGEMLEGEICTEGHATKRGGCGGGVLGMRNMVRHLWCHIHSGVVSTRVCQIERQLVLLGFGARMRVCVAGIRRRGRPRDVTHVCIPDSQLVLHCGVQTVAPAVTCRPMGALWGGVRGGGHPGRCEGIGRRRG